MKRKLLLLLLLTSTSLFSQKLLKINSASNVELNGVRLTSDQVRDVLKNNSWALENYNTGKTLNTVGSVSLGLGIGFFLGNGIYNLSHSNSSEISYGDDSDSGTSAFFVIGGVFIAAGTILKIVGNNQAKKSMEDYNEMESKAAKKEISLTVGSNGLGLALKF